MADVNQTTRVQALELHYSAGRLAMWVAITAAFVVGSIWLFGGGGSDDPARDPAWVQLLGPTGMQVVWIIFGTGSAALLVAYLRLLILADRLAAKADNQGVTINSLWGRKQLPWSDVRAIELHTLTARGNRIYFIKISPRSRKQFLVPTSAVSGGPREVENWISAVQRFLE